MAKKKKRKVLGRDGKLRDPDKKPKIVPAKDRRGFRPKQLDNELDRILDDYDPLSE